MSVYTSLFGWSVPPRLTLSQSTSSTRYADIHDQDLPYGVPNGVPKDVYFVSFGCLFGTRFCTYFGTVLRSYATSRWLNWILLRRLLQTHLVASKDPKYVAKPRALARVDIYKGDLGRLDLTSYSYSYSHPQEVGATPGRGTHPRTDPRSGPIPGPYPTGIARQSLPRSGSI